MWNGVLNTVPAASHSHCDGIFDRIANGTNERYRVDHGKLTASIAHTVATTIMLQLQTVDRISADFMATEPS
jgi:hypothetical protein